MFNNHMSCNILLNLYKHSLLLFPLAKAGILKIPGIKHKKQGYIKDNIKLKTESFIKCI